MNYRFVASWFFTALCTSSLADGAQGAQREEINAVSKQENNALVQQARADLAKREALSPDQIELVGFEELTWPDASLGCPLPGMRYKQVPVDGARIILRSPGGEWEYHSGGSRAPFQCLSGRGNSGVPRTR